MEGHQSEERHQLFLVRMWLEQLGEGKTEWRGQVQSAGGEIHYFRDTQTLAACLISMLPGAEIPADRGEDRTSRATGVDP